MRPPRCYRMLFSFFFFSLIFLFGGRWEAGGGTGNAEDGLAAFVHACLFFLSLVLVLVFALVLILDLILDHAHGFDSRFVSLRAWTDVVDILKQLAKVMLPETRLLIIVSLERCSCFPARRILFYTAQADSDAFTPILAYLFRICQDSVMRPASTAHPTTAGAREHEVAYP